MNTLQWALIISVVNVAGSSRQAAAAGRSTPSALRREAPRPPQEPGGAAGAVAGAANRSVGVGPAAPALAPRPPQAAAGPGQRLVQRIGGLLHVRWTGWALGRWVGVRGSADEDEVAHADGSEPGEKETPRIIRQFQGDGPLDLSWTKEHCFGLTRPMCALVLSLLSGISLPIGAALGILAHPVRDAHVSSLLAVGAGCLLFAVTVELYGHALHEMKKGRMLFWSEMAFVIFGAVCGSWFYTVANDWLEGQITGQNVIKHKWEGRDHAKDGLTPRAATARAALTAPGSPESNTSNPRRNVSARTVLVRGATDMMPEEEPLDENALALKKQQLNLRAKQLWMKVRIVFKLNRWVHMEIQKAQRNRNRAILQIAQEDPDKVEVEKAKALAMSLFLGLLIDGVPECMLMGFLAAENRLSMVLVISLIVANFPEAFSSASLLKRARMPNVSIIGLWAGLMTFVGLFSGLTCYVLLLVFPTYGQEEDALPIGILIFTSFVEGLAGGAMLTLIAAVILPEAMEKADNDGPVYHRSGFCAVCGFLMSVMLKVGFDAEH